MVDTPTLTPDTDNVERKRTTERVAILSFCFTLRLVILPYCDFAETGKAEEGICAK